MIIDALLAKSHLSDKCIACQFTKTKNLRTENEKLRNRNFGGRKKHDEAWMSAYNDFILKYESGMTLMEIVAEGDVSRRTAYRYLEYYKELQDKTEKKKSVRK